MRNDGYIHRGEDFRNGTSLYRCRCRVHQSDTSSPRNVVLVSLESFLQRGVGLGGGIERSEKCLKFFRPQGDTLGRLRHFLRRSQGVGEENSEKVAALSSNSRMWLSQRMLRRLSLTAVSPIPDSLLVSRVNCVPTVSAQQGVWSATHAPHSCPSRAVDRAPQEVPLGCSRRPGGVGTAYLADSAIIRSLMRLTKPAGSSS